jgi:hypothetical protein
MTTSGTYTFDPSLGELTLYAFNLCQIRPTSLMQEHMQSARVHVLEGLVGGAAAALENYHPSPSA